MEHDDEVVVVHDVLGVVAVAVVVAELTAAAVKGGIGAIVV